LASRSFNAVKALPVSAFLLVCR